MFTLFCNVAACLWILREGICIFLDFASDEPISVPHKEEPTPQEEETVFDKEEPIPQEEETIPREEEPIAYKEPTAREAFEAHFLYPPPPFAVH